jgi:uncharacterized membrane protein YedE/YeeE
MAEVADTQVTVRLGEDELLGVHLLAKLEGIDASDQAAFGDMVAFTLQRGIVERCSGAGIEWPPTAETLNLVKTIGRPASEPAPAASATGPSRKARLQMGVLAVAVVALVIGLIGGYAFNWSWTGFDSSNQVWDWFGLLLLPVAFATFPLWLKFSDYMSAARRQAMGMAVTLFVVFVLLGYLAPLAWTGFQGQTLWDWLTLLLLPVAILTVQAWPASGREVNRLHLAIAGGLVVGLAVTIVGGYESSWTWTGYQGNTLWDWLQLVLAPVAITTAVVPSLARLVSGSVDERANDEKVRKAREAALTEARARTQAQAA